MKRRECGAQQHNAIAWLQGAWKIWLTKRPVPPKGTVEVLYLYLYTLHDPFFYPHLRLPIYFKRSECSFFSDAPPPTGQWGARRSTGVYNTRHDMFAHWAVINEDLLYAHALATDHTWYGMDWYWLERH